MDSFWFNRFTVKHDNENLIFKDHLSAGHKSLPIKKFDGLKDRDLVVAYFKDGFLSSTLNLSPYKIEDHSSSNNNLFWQFPCITEKCAFLNHLSLNSPLFTEDTFHIYLGLPWATFIDRKIFPDDIIKSMKVKISGIRLALLESNLSLRIHTVCQHIYWERCLDVWSDLGINDLWLSHASKEVKQKINGINIHPWSLFAVNIEDVQRSDGVKAGKLATQKKYLASFIGAHIGHYLTADRLKLKKFENEADFYIEIQDKWHYEDVVYSHQVNNMDLESSYKLDTSVKTYNEVMSDSIFTLCPSGAGPNSLRLWEALALGCIPVVIGKEPLMPQGGSIPNINWDEIVIKVDDKQLENLPNILRSIDINEINKRQKFALEAYNIVKKQTCF
jgi:hypothetical protein